MISQDLPRILEGLHHGGSNWRHYKSFVLRQQRCWSRVCVFQQSIEVFLLFSNDPKFCFWTSWNDFFWHFWSSNADVLFQHVYNRSFTLRKCLKLGIMNQYYKSLFCLKFKQVSSILFSHFCSCFDGLSSQLWCQMSHDNWNKSWSLF